MGGRAAGLSCAWSACFRIDFTLVRIVQRILVQMRSAASSGAKAIRPRLVLHQCCARRSMRFEPHEPQRGVLRPACWQIGDPRSARAPERSHPLARFQSAACARIRASQAASFPNRTWEARILRSHPQASILGRRERRPQDLCPCVHAIRANRQSRVHQRSASPLVPQARTGAPRRPGPMLCLFLGWDPCAMPSNVVLQRNRSGQGSAGGR